MAKRTDEKELHLHSHSQNRFAVIPTPEKLDANNAFTGKGVRIAFLDSGFYPHPDIASRIIKFHDISGEEKKLDAKKAPTGVHWHGTQTTVSCAGDGSLSGGVYRGLASEAELILVKVSENGSIPEKNIEKGLKWVLKNREKFNIRILNISLGGNVDQPTTKSKINQLAEQCVEAGIVVVVAAGNSSDNRPIPPASAPSVITVGGFSDENQFDNNGYDLYHSSFGATADGNIKPEIIGPAMFVAAPILPNTKDYKAAEILSQIAAAPDYMLPKLAAEFWDKVDLPAQLDTTGPREIRATAENELREKKIVATHYQHVDGTSFAAPITASVVAQMLEANPNLRPATVKNILISTAARLSSHAASRQGHGVLNAGLAVEKAQGETHFFDHRSYSPPRVEGNMVTFFFHDDHANSVALAGDFNEWNQFFTFLTKNEDGIWRGRITMPPSGRYLYKFVINNNYWTDDHSNGMKEEDGFGGFNSILHVM